MFRCKTTISCDICGDTFLTKGNRMSDCMSKMTFERSMKRDGWRVIYGKYHICKNCFEHYGKKYIYSLFKEREQE